jgi:hypothetical protein
MSVLFVSAASASAASAVRAGQPAFARASFTRLRTVSPLGGGGGGAEEEDGGADDEDDEDDGADDELEPGADEGLGAEADVVPAGTVEPGRVCAPLVASADGACVPAGAPDAAPVRCPATVGVVRCRGDVGGPVTGRPSSPSTTGERPIAEFVEELSRDTGAPDPESAGTARAITAIMPATIPTSSAGTRRRVRNENAARIRPDRGRPGGMWCTGRRSETVEIDVVTLARLAVCAA